MTPRRAGTGLKQAPTQATRPSVGGTGLQSPMSPMSPASPFALNASSSSAGPAEGKWARHPVTFTDLNPFPSPAKHTNQAACEPATGLISGPSLFTA